MEAEGSTTIAELATTINCSPRIIKADITNLREFHSDLTFETGYFGTKVLKDSTLAVQSIYTQIISETLTYKFFEEIFFDESYSVDELAEKFYVSSSTIYRTIAQINDFF